MCWFEPIVFSFIIILPYKLQIKEYFPLRRYLTGEIYTIVSETDYADWLSY